MKKNIFSLRGSNSPALRLGFPLLCLMAFAFSSCGVPDAPEGFVAVEGGTFQMGTRDESVNERPVHTVEVDTFFIMATEVTQRLYEEVMGVNPSYFQPGVQNEFEVIEEGELQSRRPVENVSWYDTLVFCNRLSERDGLRPCYSIGGKTDAVTNGYAPLKEDARWTGVECKWTANGYRLPTEAEWEYAARGGKLSTAATVYAGSSRIEDVAWYRQNSGYKTHEVGKKKPNALGLYDMSGNVFELCWDWPHSYADNRRKNPAGPYPGTQHVERGGGWGYGADACTVTIRYFDEPYLRSDSIGFRVVRRP